MAASTWFWVKEITKKRDNNLFAPEMKPFSEFKLHTVVYVLKKRIIQKSHCDKKYKLMLIMWQAVVIG